MPQNCRAQTWHRKDDAEKQCHQAHAVDSLGCVTVTHKVRQSQSRHLPPHPPAPPSQFLTHPAFPVKWGEADNSPAPPRAPPGLQEPLFSREVPILCSDSQSVNSLCMKPCTNQCFENNDLKVSKLNFKKFGRLPYWVGELLDSHAVEMLKCAYRTQSLGVLFLLRNNL